MVELGRFSVLLALALSALGTAMGLKGALSRREEEVRGAEGAVKAAALSLTVAALALWYAFLTRDFSVEYVAEYSSRTLSIFYTLGAFWAGQPGSLLLWAWVLSLYGVGVIWQNRARNRELMAWVTPVLSGVLFFFILLLAFPSDPFKRLPFTPPDGQGLNPLLQNYGQWIHPITMYMGYVGFTVPFAFCVAALVTGNLGDTWVRTVRKWTLWAWIFLTVGIIFGGRWAYVELGWGGYWGWDPVENASLLPWLTGTAYLHSVMIQEKRGMLKVWNVVLAVATFALSLFGTFLTRSGVISSVHAFAQSSVGTYLILGTILAVLLGGGLIAWRLPELRQAGTLDSAISRESSFLLNNLLFVAIAFAVFWGTVFPLVAEAVRGVKVSVGPPFFEAVVAPLGLAVVALIGFCPLLAWRKASLRNLRRNFLLPISVGAAAAGVLSLLTKGRHPGVILTLATSAFVLATVAAEFWRGTKARRRLRQEPIVTSLARLFSRNPRRYGGYVIHVGVVVLVAAVTLHRAFATDARASLKVGDSYRVGRYSLTLASVEQKETPAKFYTQAVLEVKDASGKPLGKVRTEKAFYANQEQPTTEVGIKSTPLEDLYVILESADPAQGVAALRFLVNPAVFWVWVGAFVILAGGILVAWPSGRKAEEVRGEKERVEVAA